MSRLKPAFISLYVAYLFALSAYALLQVIRMVPPPDMWPGMWMGVLLAAGAPAGFFIWLFVAKPVRTAAHPMSITVISGLGVAIAMAIAYRYRATAGIAYLGAGIAFAGWWAYLRWYSRFGQRQSGQLAVGSQLPEFTVQDLQGTPVTSSDWRGQPHILLFYRGNWCPLCSAQIGELAQQYRALETAGAKVLLISPQPASESQKLAEKFDIPMRFLVDPDNRAARHLGIAADAGIPLGMQVLGYATETVMPTVIIVDRTGDISYADMTDNYRLRPEPEDFLHHLQTMT